MTKKPKRCHECGIGEIRPNKAKGRHAHYKTMPNLEIPEDFPIPTCNNCGAEWLDEKTADALDQRLEEAFREALKERALKSIEEISKHVSQRKLESLLGLSQGYLSKLRSGDRVPSAELVSQLALISHAPGRRIREIERFWEEE